MEVEKVQIAILSSGLGHVKRGIETWTEDLGRALFERGVRVTVYKGGGKSQADYEKVVPCVQRTSRLSQLIIRHRPSFLWRFGLGSCFTLEQTTFCWAILPELLFRQFDIIHTQEPGVALFCQRLSLFRLIRSKLILGHGTNESFDFLQKIDNLQHLAPFHLDEAIINGVRNKKAFSIGNFVDTKLFCPNENQALRQELGIPNNAFVILSVAAIMKKVKRIDYLISEVAALKDSTVYLIVAGTKSDETDELLREGKASLGGRALFLIDYPRERIPLLYAVADLFVLCTFKEMMSVALLEALSSGLPCLVHQYPVEEWMLGNGGESLDMSRPGELTHVIRKYMDVEFREEKSLMAREQALENFSRDVVVDQILKMYEDVL